MTKTKLDPDGRYDPDCTCVGCAIQKSKEILNAPILDRIKLYTILEKTAGDKIEVFYDQITHENEEKTSDFFIEVDKLSEPLLNRIEKIKEEINDLTPDELQSEVEILELEMFDRDNKIERLHWKYSGTPK